MPIKVLVRTLDLVEITRIITQIDRYTCVKGPHAVKQDLPMGCRRSNRWPFRFPFPFLSSFPFPFPLAIGYCYSHFLLLIWSARTSCNCCASFPSVGASVSCLVCFLPTMLSCFCTSCGSARLLAKTFYCPLIVPIIYPLRVMDRNGSEFDGIDCKVYFRNKLHMKLMWFY